jgi:hypothetical protein
MTLQRQVVDVNKAAFHITSGHAFFALAAAGILFLVVFMSHDFASRNVEDNRLFIYTAHAIYNLTPTGVGIFIACILLLYRFVYFIARRALILMGEVSSDDNSFSEYVTYKEVKDGLKLLSFATIFFVVCAYPIGKQASIYLPTGRVQDIGPALPGILYVALYHILPAMLAWWLVRWFPLLVAGWSAARTEHPAKPAIERSVSRKRADRAIAQELAAVLRAQELDDARALTLFKELSPWQQQIWRARYHKRTREAAQLRELVQAQEKAIRQEAGLAHDVVGMERTKRAAHSR